MVWIRAAEMYAVRRPDPATSVRSMLVREMCETATSAPEMCGPETFVREMRDPVSLGPEILDLVTPAQGMRDSATAVREDFGLPTRGLAERGRSTGRRTPGIK